MSAATLETGLFARQFDDGLLDVMVGCAALCVGLGWMFNTPIFAALGPIVAASLWPAIRKALITPRQGEVEFTARQTGKARKGLSGLTILFILCALMGLVAFGAFEGWLGPLSDLPASAILMVPGLVVGVAAIFVFAFVRLNRFLIYAAAFMVSAVVIHLTTTSGPGADLALAAIAPIVIGVVLLTRFLLGSGQDLED
jgi:hypothetical protein